MGSEFLHFDVGVRESVDVHGCQVSAALHSNTEAPGATAFAPLRVSFLNTDRRQKLQGEKKSSSLLQTVELLVLPLWTNTSEARLVGGSPRSKNGQGLIPGVGQEARFWPGEPDVSTYT